MSFFVMKKDPNLIYIVKIVKFHIPLTENYGNVPTVKTNEGIIGAPGLNKNLINLFLL